MAVFFLNIFTFIMFFQPTFVFPSLGPYRLYRYAAIIALITFLITRKKSEIKLLSISNSRFFLLFVAAQLVSASSIWLNGAIDIAQNTWLNLVIIYFLIVKLCVDDNKIKSIILMIVIGIGYLSYYSVQNYYINYGTSENLIAGFGYYENRNDLSFILVVSIPLAFALSELARSKLLWFISLFISALFTANILVASSRNGLMGLMTVGLLSLLFFKKLSRSFRLVLSVTLILLTIGLGISTVLKRSDLGGGLSGDESSENRIAQWKACLKMVKTHPLLGVGPQESQYEMVNYGGVRGLVPHNTLIQAFAETGIPGGIFFVLFAIYPLWQGYKFFKRSNLPLIDESVVLYRYLIISLCGLWVCAFFSNRLYSHILYVLIALITAVRENIFKKYSSMKTD